MSSPRRVLIPLFPGFNTLDVNGPLEVVGNRTIAAVNLFSPVIASATETTSAFENIAVKRHLSFDELLEEDDNGKLRLLDFDVMIVPGGSPDNVQAAIDHSGGNGLLDVIQTFAQQNCKPNQERWLISICTGAGFLAVRGLFTGKTVTAHWGYLDRLKELCDIASNQGDMSLTTVVRKRWVDTGKLAGGVRLVTAGGVSCGIDCTLWMVSEIAGMSIAQAVAMGMDYDWKFSNIPLTEGQVVSS